jgi:hypothetical protein
MIFKRWKYRVRDCQKRMVGYYDTLDEVLSHFELDTFLVNLLEKGYSVQDGLRYKVDVRKSYDYDSTWEM